MMKATVSDRIFTVLEPELLRRNHHITNYKIADLASMKVALSGVSRALGDLITEGKIVREGGGKNGRRLFLWYQKDRAPPKPDNDPVWDRKCLRCKKKFRTDTAFNRLCASCQHYAKTLGGW